MFNQLLLIIIGVSAGFIISGGIVGLITGLSIIPRFSAVTQTHNRIYLYECIVIYGIIIGNLIAVFQLPIVGGVWILGLAGFFSGIFLGAWILALAEIAKVLPIIIHLLNLTNTIPFMIISVAIGKTLGSFIYFYKNWI